MYEAFFNLQRRPFSATPDPSCVYPAPSVQTVIDELVVCLERGEGIAVLTAPAGLGKTLLCEKVKQELGPEFVTVLLRHGSFATSADLLRTLLAELGITAAGDSDQDLKRQLIAAVAELRRKDELLAIICDEAHHLTDGSLEELRQLADHADHGVSWIRLMLAGQLELEENLARPTLSAFNQRLRSHVTLSTLSSQDALDYVDYRITWAGGRIEEVFHPDALTAIVEAADGVPRCLNQLCDHVLLLAYVAEQRPASRELVFEALSDLQHLPLTWNVRAVREVEIGTGKRLGLDTGEPETSGTAVDFGNHLATWESSVADSERGTGARPEVWEFGAEASESADDSSQVGDDPLGNFLKAVEYELDQLEGDANEKESTGKVEEEPVIDRYAAIDGGWPEDEIPLPEYVAEASKSAAADERSSLRPAMSVPVEYPPSTSRSDRMPTIPLLRDSESAEQRLHSEMLELVATAQDAAQTRRIDSAQAPLPAPLFDDESPAEVETTSLRRSAERPFRNLFTRLRRKQKGLD